MATCSDGSSAASTQAGIPEEIDVPSFNEPEVNFFIVTPRHHTDPDTLVTDEDLSALTKDSNAADSQPMGTLKTDSSMPENVVDDPVLADLRMLPSQMARLQMRVEDIAENNVGDMEGLPMYDQVASRSRAGR